MQTKSQKLWVKDGEEYYKEIVKEFGENILREDLEIDRKKLADIIFHNRTKKERLDKITNKYVVKKIKENIENTFGCDIIIDVPLLFESGLDKICDTVIGVLAKEETCIDRIIKRDGIDKDKAIARIKSQNNENFFKINCTYCVYNDEKENAQRQLEEIINGKNLSNKNVIHIYDGNIEYLQFRRLLEYNDKLNHCYTLKPLDFGHNSNYVECKDKVLDNYKAICKSLNLNYENIYRPYQTHTNVVKKIEAEKPSILSDDFKNVDGLITDKKNQILSLTFADCIPLTFYDPVKNVIGNIHSGWQGTYKEIAREAVRKLKEEFECDPKDLICCIGPSIRNCCFETDEDVKNMFYDKFKDTGRINEIIINSQKKFKYYIDTVLINMIILQEEGININNIIDSGICTKCNSSKMHSHREDKDLAGRNTSLISLV